MLIRLIKITVSMLVSGLAARLLFEQYGFIRSEEHCRTTDDETAGHCWCSDFQFDSTACNARFSSANPKLSLHCSLHLDSQKVSVT